MSKNWLIKLSSATKEPKINLICFPFAGGGTINYAKWRSDLNKSIELYGINLPGRERYFGQPGVTDYRELINELIGAINNIPHFPLIFFGHSFGGITAYLTTLELQKRNLTPPIHLFISARVPPDCDEINKLSHLDKEAFKNVLVERYQGIPKEVLNNTEILDIFLPIIQQDFKMYEQYPELIAEYEDSKVNTNITTLGFTDDASQEETLLIWKNYTKGIYTHQQFAGGHFEVLTNWQPVVACINQVTNDWQGI